MDTIVFASDLLPGDHVTIRDDHGLVASGVVRRAVMTGQGFARIVRVSFYRGEDVPVLPGRKVVRHSSPLDYPPGYVRECDRDA